MMCLLWYHGQHSLTGAISVPQRADPPPRPLWSRGCCRSCYQALAAAWDCLTLARWRSTSVCRSASLQDGQHAAGVGSQGHAHRVGRSQQLMRPDRPHFASPCTLSSLKQRLRSPDLAQAPSLPITTDAVTLIVPRLARWCRPEGEKQSWCGLGEGRRCYQQSWRRNNGSRRSW